MKIEIIKGRAWTSDFTIVSDDGVTPVVLEQTDTATFSISTIGSTPECIIEPIPMTVKDADNGLFSVTLSTEDTAKLESRIGAEEDRFPTMVSHIGIVDCKLDSGDRTSSVDVFIRDDGTCQS